jgi:septal ring factor EnvC (AmiA/AmiB activator)
LVVGILVPALLAPGFAFSQSRKELEERRKRLQQEIRQTSTQLKATRDKEAATLRRYLTLQRQIRSREELVENLRSEIEFVDQRIVRTLEVLEALEGDANRLQKEYSAMLRVAMRQKLNQSALLFLFSANSMNDAFRRWQFLRQFERYRARQARLILETQRTLSEKTASLAERRKEKQQMLGTLQVEQIQLQGELVKKNDLLRSLKSDERKLAGELGRQQEAQNKLNNAIESIIQQEIAEPQNRAAVSPRAAAWRHPGSGNTREACPGPCRAARSSALSAPNSTPGSKM